ncbi:hypothetical protein EV360DRAFT_83446 [Lentinula raphanica]|nr:hypothetical protein EV360DRAFT_83446 [Lentinula raphanica]
MVSKRRYFDPLAPDSDDYQPDSDENTTPVHTPTRRRLHRSPPSIRVAHLQAREANQDIADSGVLDDDIGSQDFIEKLYKDRGLDVSLAHYAFFEDGASDIENEVHIDEPQSQVVDCSSTEPCESLVKSQLLEETDYTISVNQVDVLEVAMKSEQDSQLRCPFCPHVPIGCACTDFLLEEYRDMHADLHKTEDAQ